MNHSAKLADLLQSTSGLHRARVTCLAALVIALFKVKTVNLPQLGSVAEKGRVGDWRGNGRRMGVAVPGSFRNAGASLPAMAPFPVAALRTGQADLPHPALQWDHASRTRNTLATAGSR